MNVEYLRKYDLDNPIVQIEKTIQEYQLEMEDLKVHLKTIEERLNHLKKVKEILTSEGILCSRCDGTGTERYTDAAGDIDQRPCQTCWGTGRLVELHCMCGFVVTTDMWHIRRTLGECPRCGNRIQTFQPIAKGGEGT